MFKEKSRGLLLKAGLQYDTRQAIVLLCMVNVELTILNFDHNSPSMENSFYLDNTRGSNPPDLSRGVSWGVLG